MFSVMFFNPLPGDELLLHALHDGKLHRLNKFEVLVVRKKDNSVEKENSVEIAHQTFYLKNESGLYLTNPGDTNKLLLAKQDFSSNQTWCWLGDMLKCGTGKVLDIDSSYND